jgi:hypothetical protein
MVFNATFNNISVISWWSVLLVEETKVPEKTIDLSQVTDKLYHIMLYILIWQRVVSPVLIWQRVVSPVLIWQRIVSPVLIWQRGTSWL